MNYYQFYFIQGATILLNELPTYYFEMHTVNTDIS